MSLLEIILAGTPEEKEKALQAHYAALEAAPTDSDIVTAFLRDCVALDTGEPILKPDERAELDFEAGKMRIVKTH